MAKKKPFHGLKPNPKLVQPKNPFTARAGMQQVAPTIGKNPRDIPVSPLAQKGRERLAIQRYSHDVRKAVEKLAGTAHIITTGPSSTHGSTGKTYTHQISQATPYTTLYEWLTGEGSRARVFRDRDVFTEILKEHHHLGDVRAEIVELIRSKRVTSNERAHAYSLAGLKAIPYFLIDVDNVIHGLTRYNSAMTFLGGFGLTYKVKFVNYHTQTADIEFHVWNISSIHSATRPPFLSTTEWWQQDVNPVLVPWMRQHFATGALSNITQDFYWEESISWR